MTHVIKDLVITKCRLELETTEVKDEQSQAQTATAVCQPQQPPADKEVKLIDFMQIVAHQMGMFQFLSAWLMGIISVPPNIATPSLPMLVKMINA